MDALRRKSADISGTYRLVPVDVEGIAKMDAIIANITVISTDYGSMGVIAKR
jgi:hypothetical protein